MLILYRRRLLQLGLALALVTISNPPAATLAEVEALAFDAPVQLNGGPGGAARWTIVPDGGTSTGLPDSNADCQSAVNTGIMVDDAALGAQQDAYDQAGLWVNGQVFTATAVFSDGGRLQAGPMPASGLQVTLEYSATAGTPTLRTLLAVANPTAAALPITATLAVNFGSDADTTFLGTSDGDADLNSGDRWAVTGDNSAAVTDVVNTTVLFGPGFVPARPVFVTDQVFACPGAGDIAGILAEYRFTVPAGATRRLMLFQQINATPAAALAGTADFNRTPIAGEELVAGLSQGQLAEIVNWSYGHVVFLPLTRK